jgi:hypothetical protein
MSPSHARKAGVRYRNYVALPLLRGEPTQAGSVHRVPAADVETAVVKAIQHE